jgi:hypothetical protein
VADASSEETQQQAVQRAHEGLDAAHGRLEQSIGRVKQSGLNHPDLFVPLTEFCWWAISVDEGLDRLDDTYRDRRDEDPDGRVVAGLRYVRNALGHDRLTTTHMTGGVRVPIRVPMRIHVRWVWRKAAGIPVGKPQQRNRAAYEEWVARRPVEETTLQVWRWLGGEVRRIEGGDGV